MHHDLYTTLRDGITDAIHGMQEAHDLPRDLPIHAVTVEQPKDESHGDFATNAAMVLAKPAGKNPKELAQLLARHIKLDGFIEKIDIAGPGFINFTLKKETFQQQIKHILDSGIRYGQSSVGMRQNVLVEFVSANPTGPLHFGHARGAVYGDVLCSLMHKAGYDVHREYLINDAGVQVQKFARSACALFHGIDGVAEYQGDYVLACAKRVASKMGGSLPKPDELETPDGQKATRLFVSDQMMFVQGDLELAGIDFKPEAYFSEYAMHQRGEPEAAEAILREKGHVYEGVLPPPKGKEIDDYEPVEMTLFKASAFGDDVDRPLKKSDGNWTYFGADVAYHANKLQRGYGHLINVWGADHAGAIKRLKAALEALTGQKDTLEIHLTQMVRLFRGGEPVKMSKRAGTFVTMRDVLEEVGKDAMRFSLMMRKQDTPLDFDMEKAIEKSNDNPVFYVQYAHARMCAIFRQQQEMGIRPWHPRQAERRYIDLRTAFSDKRASHSAGGERRQITVKLTSLIGSADELSLVRHLCRWPMTVEKAALTREPHRIAFYAHELASRFHGWYNNQRILEAENIPLTHARLKLVKASQIVLCSAFDVLGITPVEHM